MRSAALELPSVDPFIIPALAAAGRGQANSRRGQPRPARARREL